MQPKDVLLTEESDESSSEETTSEPPTDEEDQSDQLCAEATADDSPAILSEDEATRAETDRRQRARDTLLRREYARLLAQHDPRFGLDGFWAIREEPLKIQYLMMHGWKSWLLKDEWLKQRAKEIMDS